MRTFHHSMSHWNKFLCDSFPFDIRKTAQVEELQGLRAENQRLKQSRLSSVLCCDCQTCLGDKSCSKMPISRCPNCTHTHTHTHTCLQLATLVIRMTMIMIMTTKMCDFTHQEVLSTCYRFIIIIIIIIIISSSSSSSSNDNIAIMMEPIEIFPQWNCEPTNLPVPHLLKIGTQTRCNKHWEA